VLIDEYQLGRSGQCQNHIEYDLSYLRLFIFSKECNSGKPCQVAETSDSSLTNRLDSAAEGISVIRSSQTPNDIDGYNIKWISRGAKPA
jgi:hypothetical protein